ncbi:MAG: tripartite tricarboxylate transporter family receptor [Hyphomicrobiales bacterium]|nr:tripartite tricarboxylate transporter family receptor [Hyphomicrobiales bacterium]
MLKSGALALAAVLACAAAAPAAQAQEFYKGRTLTFVIGFGPGNGYDTYSRSAARSIGKYLPGKPNVVVQNMPGAGSITAVNHLANIAPRDGTVLGMVDQAASLTQMLDPKSIKADVTKFNWIGRMTDNAAVIFAWHTAPVQKIEDAFDKELIIATAGQNSRMLSAMMRNLLGFRMRALSGYAGPQESNLAMERGEVHALTQPWSVLKFEKPEWLRDGKINILVQVGVDGHPELDAVPLLSKFARNDEERQIVDFLAGNSRIGRAVTSPPGQPAERVADLRSAFMQMMRDEDFLADIRRANLDLNPMSGEDLQALVQRTADVSPVIVEKAKKVAEFDR